MKKERTAGTVITLEKAIEYTHAFQNREPESIKSYMVSAEMLNQIMEQKDCVGLRIYNGVDPVTNKENRVLVGVDSSGEDISNGIIVEELFPCPSHCPKVSPLVKS